MDTLEDLVVRAQVGDRGAYDAIVGRFEQMALSYAYSILGDRDLAEDVRQEAFVRAWGDLMMLRDPAAFPGWFRQIVRCHSLRFARGRRVLTVPLEEATEPATDGPGPRQAAEQRETRERVARAIDQLPPPEREVTRLFYLEDWSLRQIAGRLGIPVQTVKNRLHQARARLRQRLMERVKSTVSKRNLDGDPRPREAASESAIVRFGEELQALIRTPGPAEWQRAVDLICARGRLQRLLGRLDEALASLGEGLALTPVRRDPLLRARLRAEVGLTRVQQAEYGPAREELRAAREVALRLANNSPLHAAILNGLGLCAWGEGDFRRARRLYTEMLEVNSRAGCTELEAEGRNNLALLDWKDGRLKDALSGFQAALRQWKKIRNRHGQALTLMNAGVIEENLGRLTPAGRHYHEALALAREVGFAQVEAAVAGNLANLALIQEQWSEAADHARHSLARAREIGDRRSQAIALENLALAAGGLGQGDEAARALDEGRRLAHAIGDHERELSLELVEIEHQLEQGKPEELGERLHRAEETAEALGCAAERPRLLRLAAWAEALAGQAPAAHKTLEQALHESRRQGNRPEEKKIKALVRRLANGD